MVLQKLSSALSFIITLLIPNSHPILGYFLPSIGSHNNRTKTTSMKIHIETKRLLLRDLSKEDTHGIFTLDSDPEVHIYLGNNPIKTLEDAEKNIQHIQKQYHDNGIGRWAVIEKESENFIGWSGFKYIKSIINNKTDYYDLGYRFIKQYWGKGYATETAIASLQYGFNHLNLKEICAMADVKNLASNHILQKIGMKKLNRFSYQNVLHNFYLLTQEDWIKNKAKRIITLVT